MHVADVDLGLTSPIVLPRRYFSCHGFSSRKTNCACARRGFKLGPKYVFDPAIKNRMAPSSSSSNAVAPMSVSLYSTTPRQPLSHSILLPCMMQVRK